uniref:Apoptotic chromatin condensation inducer 1 n=1 Tax=Xenopus tropicalis TaxID=8364 RepID=F7DWP6_XENTR
MAELEDVTLDGRPLDSLRVTDLRAALEERGLAKSGQKSALMKRLKGALMLENLQKHSTPHAGFQPNSQMGEEMGQNSFIKQYLEKQQELLRQRLQKEAREAAETGEPLVESEDENIPTDMVPEPPDLIRSVMKIPEEGLQKRTPKKCQPVLEEPEDSEEELPRKRERRSPRVKQAKTLKPLVLAQPLQEQEPRRVSTRVRRSKGDANTLKEEAEDVGEEEEEIDEDQEVKLDEETPKRRRSSTRTVTPQQPQKSPGPNRSPSPSGLTERRCRTLSAEAEQVPEERVPPLLPLEGIRQQMSEKHTSPESEKSVSPKFQIDRSYKSPQKWGRQTREKIERGLEPDAQKYQESSFVIRQTSSWSQESEKIKIKHQELKLNEEKEGELKPLFITKSPTSKDIKPSPALVLIKPPSQGRSDRKTTLGDHSIQIVEKSSGRGVQAMSILEKQEPATNTSVKEDSKSLQIPICPDIERSETESLPEIDQNVPRQSVTDYEPEPEKPLTVSSIGAPAITKMRKLKIKTLKSTYDHSQHDIAKIGHAHIHTNLEKETPDLSEIIVCRDVPFVPQIKECEQQSEHKTATPHPKEELDNTSVMSQQEDNRETTEHKEAEESMETEEHVDTKEHGEKGEDTSYIISDQEKLVEKPRISSPCLSVLEIAEEPSLPEHAMREELIVPCEMNAANPPTALSHSVKDISLKIQETSVLKPEEEVPQSIQEDIHVELINTKEQERASLETVKEIDSEDTSETVLCVTSTTLLSHDTSVCTEVKPSPVYLQEKDSPILVSPTEDVAVEEALEPPQDIPGFIEEVTPLKSPETNIQMAAEKDTSPINDEDSKENIPEVTVLQITTESVTDSVDQEMFDMPIVQDTPELEAPEEKNTFIQDKTNIIAVIQNVPNELKPADGLEPTVDVSFENIRDDEPTAVFAPDESSVEVQETTSSASQKHIVPLVMEEPPIPVQDDHGLDLVAKESECPSKNEYSEMMASEMLTDNQTPAETVQSKESASLITQESNELKNSNTISEGNNDSQQELFLEEKMEDTLEDSKSAFSIMQELNVNSDSLPQSTNPEEIVDKPTISTTIDEESTEFTDCTTVVQLDQPSSVEAVETLKNNIASESECLAPMETTPSTALEELEPSPENNEIETARFPDSEMPCTEEAVEKQDAAACATEEPSLHTDKDRYSRRSRSSSVSSSKSRSSSCHSDKEATKMASPEVMNSPDHQPPRSPSLPNQESSELPQSTSPPPSPKTMQLQEDLIPPLNNTVQPGRGVRRQLHSDSEDPDMQEHTKRIKLEQDSEDQDSKSPVPREQEVEEEQSPEADSGTPESEDVVMEASECQTEGETREAAPPQSSEEFCEGDDKKESTTPPRTFKRKISVISAGKCSTQPSSSTTTNSDNEGAHPARRRRWGASTATTQKKPSISISTESLKNLIPEIKEIKQEAVVDLHAEDTHISEDEAERNGDDGSHDKGLKICRTVTQVVPAEIKENGQEEGEVKEDEAENAAEPEPDPAPVEIEVAPPVEPEVKKPPAESPARAEVRVTLGDTLLRRSISQQKSGVSVTIDDPVRTASQLPSPPRNKISCIVHICNLVRPFTLGQLKELLSRTGAIIEENFWIDKIKSHCYVTYSTTEEAVATRNSLHGVKWPQSNPKFLSVDFAEQDELDFHRGLLVERPPEPKPEEPPHPHPHIPALRGEHREHDRGAREQWAEREREMERRERTRSEREWDRDKIREGPRSRSRDRRRKEHAKSKEKKNEKKEKVQEEPPAKLLDDLFHKTKAAPCIYWLPLTEDQILKKVADRAERAKEREKRRKEQEEQEEEERKERAKEREKEAERNRERAREADREKRREHSRERPRERERRETKRHSRSRSRSTPVRDRGGRR